MVTIAPKELLGLLGDGGLDAVQFVILVLMASPILAVVCIIWRSTSDQIKITRSMVRGR